VWNEAKRCFKINKMPKLSSHCGFRPADGGDAAGHSQARENVMSEANYLFLNPTSQRRDSSSPWAQDDWVRVENKATMYFRINKMRALRSYRGFDKE
jgi:hypothetical protein